MLPTPGRWRRWWLGLDPRVGLFAATIVAGVALGAGSRRGADDVVIGSFFSWILGLGALFLTYYITHGSGSNGTANVNVLFGSIFGINDQGRTLAVAVAAGVGVAMIAIARPLLFATIDPAVAQAAGVPTRQLGGLFLAIAGATVAEATQIIGALVVLGLLAAPAAAAARSDHPALARVLAVRGVFRRCDLDRRHRRLRRSRGAGHLHHHEHRRRDLPARRRDRRPRPRPAHCIGGGADNPDAKPEECNDGHATGATPARMTAQRQAVARAAASYRPFPQRPTDSTSRSANTGHTIGLTTVYRILHTFAEQKIAETQRGEDGETPLPAAHNPGHRHYLLCRRCGRAVGFTAAAIELHTQPLAETPLCRRHPPHRPVRNLSAVRRRLNACGRRQHRRGQGPRALGLEVAYRCDLAFRQQTDVLHGFASESPHWRRPDPVRDGATVAATVHGEREDLR